MGKTKINSSWQIIENSYNSYIANSFLQADTKVKYLIQYGIKHYVFNLILIDVKNQPFRFHLYKTTTSQVKKQYDTYLTYWSAKRNEIITL